MSYTRLVNGEVVEMTQEEIEARQAEEAAGQIGLVNAAIRKQLEDVDALQTKHLVGKALSGCTAVINRPGCRIDGMTPAQAIVALDAEREALLAQLVDDVYYQSK
jgi:hypothetical protein